MKMSLDECAGPAHYRGSPYPEDGAMAQKSPWHSIKQNVHHVCTNCNTGNNIEKENLRQGTGGKPRCQECQGLINRGGC